MSPTRVFQSQRPNRVNTWLAFATGCFAAALFAWLAAEVRAQSGSDGAIHVCVAGDGVLRLQGASSTCQPGQKSMHFLPGIENRQRNTPDETQSASLQRKLADLGRQAAALERWAVPGDVNSTVRAPFELVDRNGQSVFSVTNDDVYGTDVWASGQSRARLHASGFGGFLSTALTDGGPDVLAGGTGTGEGSGRFGFEVNDRGRGIRFGTDNGGETYHLKIFKADGLSAGIGQSGSGSGLAFVADRGKYLGRIFVGSQSKGIVRISDRADGTLADLTEGANGGGLLTIRNSAGAPMVEAGVAAEGHGVVRAGPEAFKPGYGVLGLPASSITGKAK